MGYFFRRLKDAWFLLRNRDGHSLSLIQAYRLSAFRIPRE